MPVKPGWHAGALGFAGVPQATGGELLSLLENKPRCEKRRAKGDYSDSAERLGKVKAKRSFPEKIHGRNGTTSGNGHRIAYC